MFGIRLSNFGSEFANFWILILNFLIFILFLCNFGFIRTGADFIVQNSIFGFSNNLEQVYFSYKFGYFELGKYPIEIRIHLQP